MPLVPERAYRMIASVGRADRVPDTAVAVRAYVNGRLAAVSRTVITRVRDGWPSVESSSSRNAQKAGGSAQGSDADLCISGTLSRRAGELRVFSKAALMSRRPHWLCGCNRRGRCSLAACRKRPFATHGQRRRQARAAVCRIPCLILCLSYVEQKSVAQRTVLTRRQRSALFSLPPREADDPGGVARGTP